MNFKKTLSIGILSALLCSSPAFAMIQNTPQHPWTEIDNLTLIAARDISPRRTWDEIARLLKRPKVECQQQFYKIRPTSTIQKKWIKKDNLTLIAVYNKLGEAWDQIAKLLSRTPRACKQQFLKITPNPTPRREWTQEENDTLLDAYSAFGNNWNNVATHLPGRTGDACKRQFIKINRTNNIQSLLESTHTPKKGSLNHPLNDECAILPDLDINSSVPNWDMDSSVSDWDMDSSVSNWDMDSFVRDWGMPSLEDWDID